jgi:predicted MPP superfamily phosphohydrolase
MDFVWWVATGIGHLGICVVIFNQIHSTSLPRLWRKRTEKILFAITVTFGLYLLWQMVALKTFGFRQVVSNNYFNSIYLRVCLVSALFFAVRWIYRKWRYRQPPQVVGHTVSIQDIQAQLGMSIYKTAKARLFKSIPGNIAHQIATERLKFRVAGLPKDLEGLKICHLSDFHLTGQLDRRYFERIASLANEFEPDLILITGDLVDEEQCLDWIEPIFGSLSASNGIFYVLGNHDRRIKDEKAYRQRLDAAGMIGVAGDWQTVSIKGATIAITGNELPWFPHAEGLKDYQHPTVAAADGNDVLKILLSHSPDQLTWARQYNFDMMFAGHTHGGQARIPLIGPIIAPSRFGILYAGGTFMIGKMLMRVTRGISGDKCLRINCPPELGLITLTGDS